MKIDIEEGIELMVDNKSAINLAKYPIVHGRRKHIETKFHFLRDQVTKGRIKLSYCKIGIIKLISNIFILGIIIISWWLEKGSEL
jgi:hypothetical protein